MDSANVHQIKSQDSRHSARRYAAQTEQTTKEQQVAPSLNNYRFAHGLGHRALTAHGNGATRINTLQNAQRTQGNRAVQRAIHRSIPVQRDGEGDDQFKFQALPPQLHAPLGPLGLDVNTSRAQLGYHDGPLGLTAGYTYGGDIFAGGSYGGLTGRLGLNPSAGSLSLGGSYGGFNAGASASLSGAAGLSLGYGAPLAPMPGALTSTMNAGGAGLTNLVGGLPGMLDNPLAGYNAHRGDISAVGSAASTLGNIAGMPASGLPLGAGLRLGYDPEHGATIMGGIQGSF